MGRYKNTVAYQPQAKTAHIQRIPSYEPPPYDAVMQQHVIHNAYVCNPCPSGSRLPTNDLPVSEQQYYSGDLSGGGDPLMDVIYAVGHPGHVDFPMLESSDLMKVDMPQEELDPDHDSMIQDVGSISAGTAPILHPQPSHLSDPLSNALRDLPMADIESVVDENFRRDSDVVLPDLQKGIALSLEGPSSNAQSGSSKLDFLDEICDMLLKLSLSDPLVVYDDRQISAVFSLACVPSERLYDDVSGLDSAYFLSPDAGSLPIVDDFTTSTSSVIVDYLTATYVLPPNDAVPKDHQLSAVPEPPPIHEPITVHTPPNVVGVHPSTFSLDTVEISHQSLVDSLCFPDLWSGTSFNVVSYDCPFAEVNQATPHIEEFKSDRKRPQVPTAHAYTINEELPSFPTDVYSQTPIQPSITKVPECTPEPPVTPVPESFENFCPPQPRKKVKVTIWDEITWIESVPETPEPCLPEPLVVEATVPIVSETPIPGDFPSVETESWPSSGENYFSRFKNCLLGW